MGITALSGPVLQYGITASATAGTGLYGNVGEYNEERSPMVTDLGDAMMDPRVAYAYQPGNAVGSVCAAFFSNYGDVDYVPLTARSCALVSTTTVTTGVVGAYTITASSSMGTYATTIIAPESGRSVSVTAIDSSGSAFLALGSGRTVNLWNPGYGTGRVLSITTSSSGDLGTWSVAGRDMYGFKMTETLALSQGTTNSSGYTIKGNKAFKYITSVVNATTPVSTGVSIGLTDTFGFPFAVPYTGGNAVVQLLASNFSSVAAVLMSSANTVLASTVATQTSTTPDVRGTYASTTASNGTLRLQMVITPAASAIAAISATDVSALFGGTQYSSV